MELPEEQFTSTAETGLNDYEKAYVYSKYIWQPVLFKKRPEDRAFVSAVYTGSFQIDTVTAEQYYNIEYPGYSGAPLQLIPLKNISEEHLKEIANMVGITGEMKLDRDDGCVFVEADEFIMMVSFSTGYIWKKKNYSLYHTNMLPVYQYLYQKGYDLPLFFKLGHWANMKTAIELGIAIERPIKTNNRDDK